MRNLLSSARSRWASRIGIKLGTVFTLLIAGVSLLVFLYFPARLEERARQALVDRATAVAAMAAYGLSAALQFEDQQGAEEVFRGAAQSRDVVCLEALNIEGRIFVAFHRDRPGQEGTFGIEHVRHVLSEAMTHRVVAPIVFNGQPVGKLRLMISLQDLHAEIGRMRATITFLCLLIFVVGMLAVFGISAVLTRHLRRIADAATEVANGDLTRRAPTQTQDEVGRLAQAFNRMVDSLESAQGQLEDSNCALEGRVERRTRSLQQEIAERTRIETALRTSEEYYRALIENASDIILVLGADGEIRFAGPAVERVFAYGPAELRGQNVFDFVHPEQLARVMEPLHQCVSEPDTVLTFEIPLRHRNGSYRLLEATAKGLPAGSRLPGIVVNARDITERKQAEVMIRNERDRARTYLDIAGTMLVAIDADERVSLINRKGCEILGYAEHEVIGQNWFDCFIPERLRDEVRAVFARIMAGEVATFEHYENRIVTKDGQERIIEWHNTLLQDGTGLRIGTLSSGIDITERRQVQAQQQQQKQLLDSIIATIPYSVFWKDRNCIYLGCNPRFAGEAGLHNPHEIVGKTDFELSWQGQAELYRVDDRAVMESGTSKLSYEEPQSRPDGSQFWLETSKVPLRDADGQTMGVVGIYTDITARKQAEQLRARALERQERLSLLQQVLLAPGNLAPKLKMITDGVVDIFAADFCRIWVVEPGDLCELGCVHAAATEGPHVCRLRDKCLRLRASSGRYTHTDGAVHRRVPFGAYKIGRVASGEDHRFLTNDAAHDPRVHDHDWVRDLGLVSFAGYQLRPLGGETLGVLALFSQQPISPEEDAQLDALGTATAQVVRAAQAEEALRESEEQFRRLVENLREDYFFYRHGVDRVLTYVSPSISNILGYSADEFQSHYTEYLTDNPINREVERHSQLSILGVKQPPYEVEIYHKDGSVRSMEVSETPVLDEQRNVIAVEGIAYDITERKQADVAITLGYQREQALNCLLKIALENVPLEKQLERTLETILAVPFLTLKNKGAIFLVTEGADELQLAVQKGLHQDLLTACARVPFGRCLCGRAAEIGEIQFAEDLDERHETTYEGIQPHGHYSVPILLEGAVVGVMVLYLPDGHQRDPKEVEFLKAVTRILAGMIASRRSAQTLETAREAQVRLAAAVDQAVEAIVITDTDGAIEYVNPAFERINGYARSEVLGRTPRILKSGQHNDEFYRDLWAKIRRGEMWSGRMINRRKDGSLCHQDVTITPVRDEDGRVVNYVGVQRDVSQEMILETQLRQAQKLEAVGSLAAGIAHEINTPIQFVGDNTHFLSDAFQQLIAMVERSRTGLSLSASGDAETGASTDSDLEYFRQEVPRAIADTLDGIQRVARIVRAMKEFSHPDKGEKAPADINRALQTTLTIARNEMKYVADVVTDFDESLPSVHCNLGGMNQVFLNILVNAAHAIADAVGDGSGGKGTITVSTRREDDSVVIAISDTGTGIPPQARDRIFDPFFTSKAVGRGTGQGLTIARAEVVDKHGGSITFDTEVGKGTTFYIRLPFHAPEPVEAS